MRTLQNTEEDPEDPESEDRGYKGAATKHFSCESRSEYVTSDNPEYVTSDNPEYSIIQHLSSS